MPFSDQQSNISDMIVTVLRIAILYRAQQSKVHSAVSNGGWLDYPSPYSLIVKVKLDSCQTRVQLCNGRGSQEKARIHTPTIIRQNRMFFCRFVVCLAYIKTCKWDMIFLKKTVTKPKSIFISIGLLHYHYLFSTFTILLAFTSLIHT